MARALTGDAAEAERVVDFVLSRGAVLLPAWRRGTMTQNWFYHHTLLAARERAAAKPAPAPKEDLLVADAADAGPEYVAFVRAVRGLPGQQCEAFILHQGEKLNSRFLGVTMDCSSAAAENHLNAANAALAAIAGTPWSCTRPCCRGPTGAAGADSRVGGAGRRAVCTLIHPAITPATVDEAGDPLCRHRCAGVRGLALAAGTVVLGGAVGQAIAFRI